MTNLVFEKNILLFDGFGREKGARLSVRVGLRGKYRVTVTVTVTATVTVRVVWIRVILVIILK